MNKKNGKLILNLAKDDFKKKLQVLILVYFGLLFSR